MLVEPSGIFVQGALFPDRLNLDFLSIPFPLRLVRCALPRGINLELATLPMLSL